MQMLPVGLLLLVLLLHTLLLCDVAAAAHRK
jgi:hypothetical protein